MEAFASASSTILGWLIESTIHVSILICLIFIIKILTRQKLPAWWHYGLWLLLVIRMLMPWSIESRLSPFNYVSALTQQETYMSFLTEYNLYAPFSLNDLYVPVISSPNRINEDVDLTDEGQAPYKSLSHLSLDKALLLVWMVGVIILGIVVWVKNLKFRKIVKRNSPIMDKSILNLFEKCKNLMEIQRDVAVVMTDEVRSPALYGYFKPRLLLPEGIVNELSKEDLHYIFLHELGHLKRHDIGIC